MIDWNITDMSDRNVNVTLRMLYVTVVIIAVFVTFGIISALNEHGIQDIPYPFYPSNIYNSRNRREISPNSVKLNITGLKHYRLPRDAVLDELSNITLSRVFWYYINTKQFGCKNVTSISAHGGGEKICAEKLKKSENNCLVYSIGDKFDFEFESNIKKEYNCEVHAIFSPRKKHKHNEKDSKQSDKHSGSKNGTRFPRGITVHHLELTEKSFHDEGRKRNKMFALIRKAFPKPNEFVDFVKIDIGGEEWNIIPKLIDSGLINQVQQLLIEVHFGQGGVLKLDNLKILRQLYIEGFRIVSCRHKVDKYSIEHVSNMTITNINEITFMNLKIKRKDFKN